MRYDEKAMGTFFHAIEVAATEAGPFVALEAVVDTGAAYSWIPRSVLTQLGVLSRRKRQFLLADGRVIERDMAIVMMRLDGEILPTFCVVGTTAARRSWVHLRLRDSL